MLRNLLNEVIDALQALFPVNRLVALLTPVLAVAAGSISVWLTEHFPGLDQIVALSPGALAAIFATGALAVVTAAYKWLDGWQLYEERQAEPMLEPGEPEPDQDFDPENLADPD